MSEEYQQHLHSRLKYGSVNNWHYMVKMTYFQDYLILVILCKNTYMTRDPCQNDMLTDFTNLNYLKNERVMQLAIAIRLESESK
jgi:hypothetical protein